MKKKNDKNKEQKLWLLVFGSLLVVVLIWGLTVKFNLNNLKDDDSFSWPDLSMEGDSNPWEQLQEGLQSFGELLDKEGTDLEEIAEETPEKKILTNPNNLSEKEIEDLEKELFPEKKDAQ